MRDRKKQEEFIIGFSFAFLVIGLLFKRDAFLYAAVVLLGCAVCCKAWALWAVEKWLQLMHVLSTAITRVVLFIVFFVFLLPTAFLYRLVRGKKHETATTNWLVRRKKFTPEDFLNSW